VLDNPIVCLDNFFPKSMYDYILEDSNNNWQLRNDFIYKDLTDSFFTKDCLFHMKNKIDKNISLYRGYAHGHKFHEHHIHQDNNATHTAILFVAKEYEEDWLGGTIIYTDVVNYLPFIPNRLIIFHANLNHVGSNFQNTNNFRVQYIWKLNIRSKDD